MLGNIEGTHQLNEHEFEQTPGDSEGLPCLFPGTHFILNGLKDQGAMALRAWLSFLMTTWPGGYPPTFPNLRLWIVSTFVSLLLVTFLGWPQTHLWDFICMYHRTKLPHQGDMRWNVTKRYQEVWVPLGISQEERKLAICRWPHIRLGIPGGSDGNESACNAGDLSSIPGPGRSPGEGDGSPVQYFYLENSMDRGAWRARVLGSQRVEHDWAT